MFPPFSSHQSFWPLHLYMRFKQWMLRARRFVMLDCFTLYITLVFQGNRQYTNIYYHKITLRNCGNTKFWCVIFCNSLCSLFKSSLVVVSKPFLISRIAFFFYIEVLYVVKDLTIQHSHNNKHKNMHRNPCIHIHTRYTHRHRQPPPHTHTHTHTLTLFQLPQVTPWQFPHSIKHVQSWKWVLMQVNKNKYE